jgi:hypothetical protein
MGLTQNSLVKGALKNKPCTPNPTVTSTQVLTLPWRRIRRSLVRYPGGICTVQLWLAARLPKDEGLVGHGRTVTQTAAEVA